MCVLIRTHTAVATGLTATTTVVPRLSQAVIDSDPMTKKPHPGPFNGYAPSADVNGSYVYVVRGSGASFRSST